MKLVFLLVVFCSCAYAWPDDGQTSAMPFLPASIVGNFEKSPLDKIVGGKEVTPHSVPFQISLQLRLGIRYVHICGGSILDQLTILTAAHCVERMSESDLRIVAGAHRLSETRIGQQTVGVQKIISNTAYDRTTLVNDIALIKLATRLNFSATVGAISLPPPTFQFDPPTGFTVTISGWGYTTEGGTVSDVLLSVNVPVVSDAVCDLRYGGTDFKQVIFPSMLCAGGRSGGIDSCQGDSGGPVFSGTGLTAVQHGVVSWGRGCARAAYPGVNTQLSFLLDWIESNRIM